jgi:hypothetical protein
MTGCRLPKCILDCKPTGRRDVGRELNRNRPEDLCLEVDDGCSLDSSDSGEVPVAVSCELGKEYSGSIKIGAN